MWMRVKPSVCQRMLADGLEQQGGIAMQELRGQAGPPPIDVAIQYHDRR